jgi:hypothetical protein
VPLVLAGILDEPGRPWGSSAQRRRGFAVELCNRVRRRSEDQALYRNDAIEPRMNANGRELNP